MPILITASYILWAFLSLVTAWSMIHALLREREIPLEKRVKLLLVGMILTVLGNLFFPWNWGIGSYFLTLFSTILMASGALITTQIMLEWKYGKWIWAKLLLVGILISVGVALI